MKFSEWLTDWVGMRVLLCDGGPQQQQPGVIGPGDQPPRLSQAQVDLFRQQASQFQQQQQFSQFPQVAVTEQKCQIFQSKYFPRIQIVWQNLPIFISHRSLSQQ